MASSKRTPIDRNLVDRMSGAIRGAIAGARTAWFGPGEPLNVVAPPSVHGRLTDYPVAWNLSVQPRGEQGETGISFADLRALADPTLGGFDLIRLAIETRKDQMESQRWFIRNRDESDGGARARAIELALRLPDAEHTFSQWQRMLLEDLLVIDAPTAYLAPSLKGYLIPQVMDGALLKPLLQEDGRAPIPPEPSYQQVLKGVPASRYTLDEIVRLPRNLRSHRVYGMSPVEQVVTTINIALRRQLFQLEHYTAGSVPDAVANVPETWTPDQIRQFQTWWDSIFSGNTEERRRLRFIPFGVGISPLKPEVLKDPFDEWLARIICYCFSLSPQALVKEMNRATSQTAKQSAQEEGLEPLKLWWKDFVDAILLKAFDAPELELWYRDEEISDPQGKATVYSLLAGGKPIITLDEARAAFGYDKLNGTQREELNPAPPPMPEPDANASSDASNASPPKDDKSTKLLAKVVRSLRPAPAPRVDVVRDQQGRVTAYVPTSEET